MPRRSSRPLMNALQKLSIKNLKNWDLLQLGCNNRKSLDNGLEIETSLADERKTCRIAIEKNFLIFQLESRPLGGGLVWYFRDPASGALCTTLYFHNGLVGSRKTVKALYVTQFQDKTYRKLLAMGKLVVAINGDPDSNIGPGRGSRKLKNIETLRQKVGEIVSIQEHLDKILDINPELLRIPQSAMATLRRELLRLPKEWEKFDRLQKAAGRSLYDYEDKL